ncbi:hypothetical protein JCM8547_000071 [Rhodosporidiobolus lusitaniae]
MLSSDVSQAVEDGFYEGELLCSLERSSSSSSSSSAAEVENVAEISMQLDLVPVEAGGGREGGKYQAFEPSRDVFDGPIELVMDHLVPFPSSAGKSDYFLSLTFSPSRSHFPTTPYTFSLPLPSASSPPSSSSQARGQAFEATLPFASEGDPLVGLGVSIRLSPSPSPPALPSSSRRDPDVSESFLSSRLSALSLSTSLSPLSKDPRYLPSSSASSQPWIPDAVAVKYLGLADEGGLVRKVQERERKVGRDGRRGVEGRVEMGEMGEGKGLWRVGYDLETRRPIEPGTKHKLVTYDTIDSTAFLTRKFDEQMLSTSLSREEKICNRAYIRFTLLNPIVPLSVLLLPSV